MFFLKTILEFYFLKKPALSCSAKSKTKFLAIADKVCTRVILRNYIKDILVAS